MPPTNLQPLGDTEYESIAAAMMETGRGRWFLAEYARRNRNADTAMLMTALQRLEKVVAGHAAAPPDGTRAALAEMARALERTKAQLAVLRPDPENGRRLTGGQEFDAVARDQEEATADVVAAAERVQDVAWTLREQSIDDRHCADLEGRAADIYAACARQDLAAQRTRRMIQALRFVDARIATLLALWSGGPASAVEPQPQEPAQIADSAAENQEDAPPASSEGREPEPDRFTSLAALLAVRAPVDEPAAGKDAAALAEPSPARDPLASLKALTPEETLALFS